MTNLKIKDIAPNFITPIIGGKFNLSAHKGKKIVLYFYPKDNTSGCTTETENFRDLYAEFQRLNVEIIGISKDSLKSHQKFIDKISIPFQLGSDEEQEVCKKYGVWVEKSMYGKKYMGIERSTFLIAEDGKIAEIWRKVKIKDHANIVLQTIKNA